VIALRQVAPQQRQALERRLVLHALGDDSQPEIVAEVDRRAHDDQVALVAEHRRDERPVDLELVDRQAPEIRKRRVTRTEIVDRQTNAQRAQARDRRQRPLGV
jgi:hypothetical protein